MSIAPPPAPATLDDLMCRTTLSVDWNGDLFDCDFNQMLDLRLAMERPRSIFELDDAALSGLAGRGIATGPHCYACTAGAGSSCSGSLL